MMASRTTLVWVLTILLAKGWRANGNCAAWFPVADVYTASVIDQDLSYRNNSAYYMKCAWRIQSEYDSFNVQVVVLQSTLGSSSICSNVYMEAFDGYYDFSRSLQKWCGSDTPTIRSTGRTMTLYLTTFSPSIDIQFHLRYRAVLGSNTFAPITFSTSYTYRPSYTYTTTYSYSYYRYVGFVTVPLLIIICSVIGISVRKRRLAALQQAALEAESRRGFAPMAVVSTTQTVASAPPAHPSPPAFNGYSVPYGAFPQGPVAPPPYPTVTDKGMDGQRLRNPPPYSGSSATAAEGRHDHRYVNQSFTP